MVQKIITLFHSTATIFASFYRCTYIPVGFVVKNLGCYLKIVPNYKFSQHSKKHLELHPKMFIINWHNSFSLRMNLFWNQSFHQFLWSSLGIRLRVKMVDWCFCFVLYCRVQWNLFNPGNNILTSVSIFSILFSLHFLRCWQGEFVEQSTASLVGDHFFPFCDLYKWFRGNNV